MVEVMQIHSVAGLSIAPILEGRRPYRSPHHGVSEAGLIGGGTIPRPGEISLAHRGVLFLDELPEFRRGALESLRAPLETRSVSIARARGSVTFPAQFQLLAAMNPCPCGRSGVPGTQCLCGVHDVSRYLRKLSQPLLDRFDIQVELDAVALSALHSSPGSDFALCRVERLQSLRAELLAQRRRVNSALSNKEVHEVARLDSSARTFLKHVAERGVLSARGYYRVLRVSRTIADLGAHEHVSDEHIAEAVAFRSLERMSTQCASL
jgi:magnesium chelatase family protein